MGHAWAVKGIVFVLGLGLMIPGSGCFGSGSDDEYKGRICASPLEGGRYCVPTSDGPAAAWDKANMAGTEPITMWAEWPKDVTTKEVVSNPELLGAWLDDVQAVNEYLRVTRGNAESYYASLAGKQASLLLQARQAQKEFMAEKAVEPKTLLTTALLEKGAKETDPLKVEIAADKQAMRDVQVILDAAKIDAGPFATQYKALVDVFVAYRKSEAQETTDYANISLEASAAGLDELTALENDLLDKAHLASAKPNELLVNGMKLSAEILQFENTSREALSPHADFMSTHGATIPDSSSGALRSINAILGYAQQRVTRSDATAKELVLGIGMRRRALQLLASAPSPARTTVANALLAKASAKFAKTAQTRLDAVATISMSNTLGLPYLAQRYDEYAALSLMAPLCNPKSSSWRETGCVSMRPKFKDAATYLKITLPEQIKQGLATMKNKGADASAIKKVEQKLNAGDIKGAALAHDALLSSLEGT